MFCRGPVHPLARLPDCHLSLTLVVGVMTPRTSQAQPEKETMVTWGLWATYSSKSQKVLDDASKF